MKKIHALVISALVGLGSIVGLATTARSAGIGQPDAQISSSRSSHDDHDDDREQRLRADSAAVKRVVDRRWATYRAQLQQRNSQIADAAEAEFHRLEIERTSGRFDPTVHDAV